MASTSETGHAKNVANFEDLIGFCAGYGPAYNPSKATLTLPTLNTLLSDAGIALQNVKTAKTTYDNAQNARESAVKPLKSLATRLVNALAATNASRQTLDDARTIAARIHGRRAVAVKKTKEEPGVEVAQLPRKASVSQQSYDKIIDNFDHLIATISVEPSYTPNEIDLQPATLTAIIADIKIKNAAFIVAHTNLSNARIARDKILYNERTGLLDVTLEIKSYVKSVFGSRSAEYKQISSLQFNRSKRA